MRNLTRYLLWAYVFTISWDVIPLGLLGSISRVVGLAFVSMALLTMIQQARFRKPEPILAFAAAFSVFGMLSLLWTISYQDTATRAFTYVQLLGSAWLIREYVRTREQTEPLMTAFCLGSFVPMTSVLRNFSTGVTTQGETRFTATGANANILGILLVIGLPLAWHLILHRRGVVRAVAVIYFALTPLVLLLTATRGGFVAGIVALAIVPLTLPRQSLKSYLVVGVLLGVAMVPTTLFVPRGNWERILSISTELTEGGRLSGRTHIWRAGLQVYPERPFLGFGAGAYTMAIEPLRRESAVGSHNTFIGLLVEEGMVGLLLFIGVMAACAWTIYQAPPPHRALWAIVMLTWLVGAMDANFEYSKITWVLFGLISAQTGLTPAVTVTAAILTEKDRTVAAATARLLHPAHVSPAVRLPTGR
jgi:O-antigen ligase